MGPYCNFCNQRCFTYFPQETPDYILRAYGTSTIIATCQGGQRFEKQRVGYCYDDILAVSFKHTVLPADSTPTPSPSERADNADRQAETDYSHSDGAHAPDDYDG